MKALKWNRERTLAFMSGIHFHTERIIHDVWVGGSWKMEKTNQLWQDRQITACCIRINVRGTRWWDDGFIYEDRDTVFRGSAFCQSKVVRHANTLSVGEISMARVRLVAYAQGTPCWLPTQCQSTIRLDRPKLERESRGRRDTVDADRWKWGVGTQFRWAPFHHLRAQN